MAFSSPSFSESRLVGMDFDGTVARTFDPSPNKIDVGEAYRRSVEEVLGLQALGQYIDAGEHRNRAPSDIVAELAPDMDEAELHENTDRLVRIKLDVLLGEISRNAEGVMWPMPTDGFLRFWENVTSQQPNRLINTALVSFGHTAFIQKAFDLWGIKHPDILVTDEVVRSVQPEVPIADKLKPAPFALELAIREWVAGRWEVRPEYLGDAIKAAKSEGRIVFVGDDLGKDGGLAENCGVPFVHLEIARAEEAWQQVEDLVNINNRDLAPARNPA